MLMEHETRVLNNVIMFVVQMCFRARISGLVPDENIKKEANISIIP